MKIDRDDLQQSTDRNPHSAENVSDLESLKAERTSIIHEFRALAALAVLLLIIGAVFYHETEHWSWINSFYFCTMTLTTIGYGDLVPTTDGGKLFDIFYVFIGIGTIALFVNTTIKNAMIRRQFRRYKRRVN